MWAMTPFGILMPAIRPPATVKYGDQRTMQIRARRARDLDILRAKYMPAALGPTLYTPDKDYEYRAYCVPSDFALAMARMVMEIDYLKFKPTATDRYADDELHDAYNAVWATVLRELSTTKHRWSSYRHFDSDKTGSDKTSSDKSKPGKGSGKHQPAKGEPGKNGAAAGTSGARHAQPAGPSTAATPAPLTRWIDRTDDDYWVDGKLGLPNPATGYRGTGTGYGSSSGSTAGTGRRDTSYDRDQYEPDVHEVAAEEAELLASENALVESLYREIDVILDARRLALPIDHSTCDHPASDNARARCRRRRRRGESRRIAEIRDLIEASRLDAFTDLATDLASDTGGDPGPDTTGPDTTPTTTTGPKVIEVEPAFTEPATASCDALDVIGAATGGVR